MIRYFAIQNTIHAILRKYQNILFFPSIIGFRPFQTPCTILCLCLPVEMTLRCCLPSTIVVIFIFKNMFCFEKPVGGQKVPFSIKKSASSDSAQKEVFITYKILMRVSFRTALAIANFMVKY
jgi:hypothetical protein